MANSASESTSLADSVGLKHISNSLFSIPGFFAGFRTKGSTDVDSLRSPTSPLDLKLFPNLSNPFSFRSISPAENGLQKKFVCKEIGLGIINLIFDDYEPTSEVLDLERRKNVIFAPQVRTKISKPASHHIESLGSYLKSNSLPSNYTISSVSSSKIPNFNSGFTSSVSGNGEFSGLESELFENNASFLSNSSSLFSSSIGMARNPDPSGEIFPLITNNGTEEENSLLIKSCSLPIAISSSHGCVGSLTAREIELSEDYTCIISHGPNPKKTHIFGDCILECHTDKLTDSREMEDLGTESSSPLASCLEGLTPSPLDGNSQLCFTCKKILIDEDDIYLYRDGKAFCSSECGSREIFADDGMEKTSNDEDKSSRVSSYHEDLFIMGLPQTLPFAL